MTEFLELGPGTKPHPAATSYLDLMDGFDIGTMHWPHRDKTQDVVYSSHLLEHIPKGKPTIHVFNEALRVLKPGGRFFNILPLVGFNNELVARPEPYADPTHVQFWWLPDALWYFTGQAQLDAEYGINTGWGDLGPQVDINFAVTEKTMLAHPGIEGNFDTFWSVDHWEGTFAMVKR